MKYLLLMMTIGLMSCTTSVKINPVVTELIDEERYRFALSFLKDKQTKFDMGISGISYAQKPLIIKKEDISCGKGAEQGGVVKVGRVKEPELAILTTGYKDFYVVCQIDTKIEGDYYVNFASIRTIAGGNSLLAKDEIATNVKFAIH